MHHSTTFHPAASTVDPHWRISMEQLGAIRLFTSHYVRKSTKHSLTSAQEIDLLFRVALAQNPITPLFLHQQMGISKTTVSRLLDQLDRKKLLVKVHDQEDQRSYSLRITTAGKQELDNTYHYYLAPFYHLKEVLGAEDFSCSLSLIEKANRAWTDESGSL